MRLAVLDLGTNTFNLIIAETTNRKEFTILFEEKLPVKLGKGGIHNKFIQPDAMKRAENALNQHYQNILKFKATEIRALGTSALRGANNTEELLSNIKNKFNIFVQLIDGNKEAELIYKGVRQTLDLGLKPVLILDVGGGSNEFIIASANEIFWKHSFDLGIARLLEMFKPSDPISQTELSRINACFEKDLEPLFIAARKYSTYHMIGASGTFDTLVSMIDAGKSKTIATTHSRSISLDDFNALYNKLLPSNHKERLKMPGLDIMRVEMMVLAIHFVKFVIDKVGISTLSQSDFSLKEGAVFELMNER